MTGQMGVKIVDVLEQAGELYLGLEPKIYQAFLLQVGATDALRRYDPTEAYWERLQAVLDGFFTSAERAQVCERLIDRAELRAARRVPELPLPRPGRAAAPGSDPPRDGCRHGARADRRRRQRSARIGLPASEKSVLAALTPGLWLCTRGTRG